MNRRKSKSPTRQEADRLPAPFDHIFCAHDFTYDRLVTTLLLAGESMAAPMRRHIDLFPMPSRAAPVGDEGTAILDDFGWLTEILELIHARLSEDPRRAQLVAQLPEAFGDGDLLRLLFHKLFPKVHTSPAPDSKGDPVLTPAEVAVLREAAKDISHAEMGKNLGISARTVSTHLSHIYAKLDVGKPFQAIARAVSMGYLPINTFDLIPAAARCGVRDFTEIDFLVNCMAGTEEISEDSTLKPAAAFGLLLLLVSGSTAYSIRGDKEAPDTPRGIVCRINAQGEVVQTFGSEHLWKAFGICVAPPQAARQGFTPGNLYVADYRFTDNGLNRCAVAEFTPDGRFVRSFCGGRDVSTHLSGDNYGLAFAASGRLLVGSRQALLCFDKGGARVRRFTDGACGNFFVADSGLVYAAQYSGLGCLISVFDEQGRRLRSITGKHKGSIFAGIVVNSRGHLLVIRYERVNSCLEEYDCEGQFVRTIPVPGYPLGRMAIDTLDRLYVPCHRSRDIKILSQDGSLVQQIPLRGIMRPEGITLDGKGGMWVCGERV